jgi:hypothetical protein
MRYSGVTPGGDLPSIGSGIVSRGPTLSKGLRFLREIRRAEEEPTPDAPTGQLAFAV